MKSLKELNKWTNDHSNNFVLDILRWFLGIFLFVKGVSFMSNSQELYEIMDPQHEFIGTLFLVHYISMAHFAGGILIAFGLLTRLAIGLQLPILIGAVAVNFIFVMEPVNLLWSSIVLILAIGFLIIGSGRHSVDYRLKMGT